MLQAGLASATTTQPTRPKARAENNWSRPHLMLSGDLDFRHFAPGRLSTNGRGRLCLPGERPDAQVRGAFGRTRTPGENGLRYRELRAKLVYFPTGEGGKGRAEHTPWVPELVGSPRCTDVAVGHSLSTRSSRGFQNIDKNDPPPHFPPCAQVRWGHLCAGAPVPPCSCLRSGRGSLSSPSLCTPFFLGVSP